MATHVVSGEGGGQRGDVGGVHPFVGLEVAEQSRGEIGGQKRLERRAVAAVAGGIDNVRRVVKVVVYVASTPGFTAQPAVANGASTLLGEVFGEAGAHVRSAVGVSVLPLDAPVEVELVVEA